MSTDRSSTALMAWMPRPDFFDEIEPEPLAPGMLSLLAAVRTLAYRASGPSAWAAPLARDPIAFLLDAASDGILVWRASGELLFANPAAERLDLQRPAAPGISRLDRAAQQFERRTVTFASPAVTYTVEIVRPIRRDE